MSNVTNNGVPVTIPLQANTAYAKTTAYQLDNGDIVFGLLRIPLIPDSSDTLYVVNQVTQNRLDLVSQQVYGTPELYWAIAALNNINDLQAGIPTGTQLRIPSKSRIPTI